MRNLKKLVAVGLTAAMTLAMSLSAFAGDVTFHFKNAAGWSDVGAWIFEDIQFKTPAMPQDKCPVYNTNTNRAIWPGAKMEKEADYDGWYSITTSVTDTSKGAVVIFNNLVGDTKADTATGGDATDDQFLQASSIVKDTSAKKQTPNQIVKATDFTGSEYWCDFDGNTAGTAKMFLSAAPASYVKTATASTTETTAAGSTSTAATTASTTSNTSVKTGDSVAYAIILVGAAAAVVFVASRKRVNE